MFTPDSTTQARLTKLGANYRFRLHGPTSRFHCHIIDIQTGKTYASGEGGTEPEALGNAVTAAESAAKPMTKAQRADPRLSELLSSAAAKDEEIAQLRARIAELEGSRDSCDDPDQLTLDKSPE